MFESHHPAPLEQVIHPLFSKKGIEIFLKREDKIDQEISGNKWRKLKYNLIEAEKQSRQTILTFGGAYSNHIAATATACKRFGFQSIGIIRGDELNPDSNPTLQKAHADGMILEFISRSEYKNRTDADWLKLLEDKYEALIIPEGGSNELALKGIKELVDEIELKFSHVLCPVGTGGTLSGIIKGLTTDQKAIGISSLKGEGYLNDMILAFVETVHNWQLIHDYHFGGYAKYNDQLIDFINQFYAQTSIPLDPIYTGKMMFGLFDLVKKDYFEEGSKIVCIHTGGLQGISGFNEKNGQLLNFNL